MYFETEFAKRMAALSWRSVKTQSRSSMINMRREDTRLESDARFFIVIRTFPGESISNQLDVTNLFIQIRKEKTNINHCPQLSQMERRNSP